MKSLLLLLVFLTAITLQFSCKKDKADSNVQSDFVIEHPSGFSVHFQRNAAASNILDVSKEDDLPALLQIVNLNFSKLKSEFITLMNFKLDIGDNYSYLIFEGYNKVTKLTSSFAYLIQLDADHQRALFKSSSARTNDMLSGARTQSYNRIDNDEIVEGNHSCTGAPCSCCKFLRRPSDGSIYGCSCEGGYWPGCSLMSDQICNHSTTAIDTDGDGIEDDEDECPTQPGPPSNMGCPIE